MKKKRLIVALLLCLLLPSAQSQFIQKHKWNAIESGGGGFITGFCFSKQEQNVMYARTDVGGAYRWVESTKSWTRLHDWVKSSEWPLMGIQSMCIDPSMPSRIYMMGGMYNNSPSAIMRSDDYGQTFKRFVTPFLITGTASPNGERLCVDPNLTSVIYCSTHRSGLWKSTNYGETWTQVSSFTNAVSITTGETLSISFVIVDGSTGTTGTLTPRIVVGVNRTGSNNIYMSEDGGATWQAVAGLDNGARPQRAELSNGYVYVTFNSAESPYSGTKGGFYRINMATKEVKDITPLGAKTVGYSGLTIDSKNPNHIIITNTSGVKWAPTGMYGERIWRTKDGGTTWTDLVGSSLLKMDYQGYDWAAAVNPHWICNVTFDPFNSNRFFFTSGNGLFRCENLGDFDANKNFTFLFSTKGLNENVVFDFVAPNSGAELIDVIGDYAGFRHMKLDQPGTRLLPAGGANNLCIDVADKNPNVVVRSTSNPAGGALYSTDNGVTWSLLSKYAVADSVYAGNIAVSTDGSYIVWAPKDKPVRMTYDNGATWEISTGVAKNLKPVADKVNPAKFYMFDGSNLSVSEDAGQTFTTHAVAMYGLPTGTFGYLRTFPGREGEIWFPLNDRGLYFSKWVNNKPQFVKVESVDYCRAIGFGLAKPGSGQPATLFIHGKVKTSSFDGVFRSDDMGATWVQVNDDTHEFAGIGRAVLVGDPRVYGRVFMSTGGGLGVIYGEIDGNIINGDLEAPATTIKVGASQTYKTIQAAYNSIPDSPATAVLIELQSDYAPSSETFPVVFTKKAGASVSNYILIRPAAGVAKELESANTIFSFNGSRCVKIDGRPAGEGSDKGLTLTTTSISATAKTIEFINDSYRNTIRYCGVYGSGRSTTSGTIVVGTTTGTTPRSGTTGDYYGSGNLHNTIDHCDIGDGAAGTPTTAIYLKGTPTYTNEGTVITNNNIFNFFTDSYDVKSCGVFNDVDCHSTEIKGNRLYQTEARTFTGSPLIYPIYLNTAGTITTIDDNLIGAADETGSGIWTMSTTGGARFAGIMINQYKGGNTLSLSGNKIFNIDFTTYSPGNGTEGVMTGIVIKAGNMGNAVATRPNEVTGLTLRFGTSVSGSNGLCGLSYNFGGGSANTGYLKVNNLKAIPTGASASVLTGKVMGVSTQNSYGGSCKMTEVHDLSCGSDISKATHQIYGIYTHTGSNQVNKVERNWVYNLNAISTGASTVYGLACGAGSGVLTLRNNMVCLGNDMSSGGAVCGIYKSTTGADVITHNTVYIGGTAVGVTQNSYAFQRDVATETTANGNYVRNNIFVNKRTGGTTGKHYVLAMKLTTDYSNSFPVSCNYNIYDYATGANSQFGNIGGINLDFAVWKSTTKFDTNSNVGDPLFVDATNLTAPNLLIRHNSALVDKTGDASQTATEDYFGSIRANLTPCDPGAYSFIFDASAGVSAVRADRLFAFASGQGVVISGCENKVVRIFAFDGKMVLSQRLSSDNQTIPLAAGFYIVRVENRSTKVFVK